MVWPEKTGIGMPGLDCDGFYSICLLIDCSLPIHQDINQWLIESCVDEGGVFSC